MKSLKNLVCFCVVVWAAFSPARAQETVRINEFMASNGGVLLDQDLEKSDWIELYNGGTNAVDLNGWILTDDPNHANVWRFPPVTIVPKGFLTVFASGKNRTNATSELHTSFSLKAEGEYLALLKPDGTTIVSEFNDYPAQQSNISYGVAQGVATNQFLATGAGIRYFVPTNSSSAAGWTSLAQCPDSLCGTSRRTHWSVRSRTRKR